MLHCHVVHAVASQLLGAPLCGRHRAMLQGCLGHMLQGLLQGMWSRTYESKRLCAAHCRAPTASIHPTRCRLDRDQDGALSRPELQAMLVSLELAGNPYDDEQLGSQVGFWLREMEGEGSEAISRAAFLAGGGTQLTSGTDVVLL
jgi:hypothetical protein